MDTKLSFSKKKKCQGCLALKRLGDTYTCILGVGISFELKQDIPMHPKPKTKCYKPKTKEGLKELKNKL